MKLLLDQNLSFKLCDALADLYPGSTHVFTMGFAEADDAAIWRIAGEGGFVLVSQDADFAEIAFLRGPPPKVIWLRCGNKSTAFIAQLLRDRTDAIHHFCEDTSKDCLEIY